MDEGEKKVYALINIVASNRDCLRQSNDSLRQIYDRGNCSNESSINLIAQITALKSNLGVMQDWLNFAIDDLHPQLLSDLDGLMASCGLLVRHLDDLIEQLGPPNYDTIDFAVKLKYVVGSRSMERLREVAERQNNAVTLILAACKCHATAQRKILLHKSRQIRTEDAANLKILARSARWNGGCIGFLTQISRMIQWFRFLFHMKMVPCRNEIHRDHDLTPTGEEYEIAAAAVRSDAIDRALQEEATSLRRETKLVMVGHISSGKELVMHQMKVLYARGYYSSEQRKTYRSAVRSTTRLLLHSIIDLLKDTGLHLPSNLTQDFAILLHEVETKDTQHITPEAVKAVKNIWTYPDFAKKYTRNFEIDFPQYAPYFAQELARIAGKDYLPSEADIIRLNQDFGGIKELRFNWDELDVHLFNINGYIPDQFRKRWFHQLENATSLVYTVDVSRYDRPHLGQSKDSQLLDDFRNFEAWANSPKFANSSIILLLNNFSRFREKLQYSPLTTFFPEYKPSTTNPEISARQYILKRFKDVNRGRLSIYSFWVDLDMSDNQHLYAALKKTLQHIQQRKARDEVWSKSGSSNPLSHTRSGTLSGKLSGLNSSKVISPSPSHETL